VPAVDVGSSSFSVVDAIEVIATVPCDVGSVHARGRCERVAGDISRAPKVDSIIAIAIERTASDDPLGA
jgi:hypothetical protein